MLTGVPAGSTSAGTATMEPSLPSTTPPVGPSTTVPICGVCTRTLMVASAGPLMTVTVTVPGATAVIKPLALTVTTPGWLKKYWVPEACGGAEVGGQMHVIARMHINLQWVPPLLLRDTDGG